MIFISEILADLQPHELVYMGGNFYNATSLEIYAQANGLDSLDGPVSIFNKKNSGSREFKRNLATAFEGKYIQSSTMEEIRSSATALPDVVYVDGAFFQFDPEDNSTVDDGETCLVSVGGRRYKTVVQAETLTANVLGIPTEVPRQIDLTNALIVFDGDSTTEGLGNANTIAKAVALRRLEGPFYGVNGLVNHGGSGFTIKGWFEGAETPGFVGASEGSLTWDYNLKKPVGAVNLNNSLKTVANIRVICYGINDCILYANPGALPEADIVTYIAGYLRQAVDKIRTVEPQSIIVLRIPNPMTARPLNAGFPSLIAHPTFGNDLAADRALVEKWNQALRKAYIQVSTERSRTILYDTWKLIYGWSDTTKLASTELVMLGDLVHPNTNGYSATVEELGLLLNPNVDKPTLAQKKSAESKATNLGGNPQDYLASYLYDNPLYSLVTELVIQAVGSNYMDLMISKANWDTIIPLGEILYIEHVGRGVYQLPTNYNPFLQAATTTRLLAVAPPAELRFPGKARIYTLKKPLLTTKLPTSAYLIGRVLSINPRRFIRGTINGAGNGYFDIAFLNDNNRPSSRFLTNMGIANFRKLIMEVAGSTNAAVSLTSATGVGMHGTPVSRVVRVSIPGDQSAYASSEVVLFLDDSTPNPAAFEYEQSAFGWCSMATGSRTMVMLPTPMSLGIATITASTSEVIAQAIVIEVYRPLWPSGRGALITTITVPANGSTVSVVPGLTSYLAAGVAYEFVVTTGTASLPNAIIKFTINPTV